VNTNKKTQAGLALRPLAASVALAMAGLAQAQDAQTTQASDKLEQVVVTANKRAQNLQDVPQSITVLNDATLQRNNVRGIDDLTSLSPALTISYSTQPGNFSINMRGVGTYSLGIGVEADVAVVVDDIPYAMQANAFKDLADASRVEVLKGPQTTLIGKSAIAGAVNITTKPIDNAWHERFNTYLTSDGEWRAGGSVSGAINDDLRVRLSATKSDFGGVVKNLTNGDRLNGSRYGSLQGKVEWNASDDLTVNFSARASQSTVNCCVQPFSSMTPGGLYQNIAQLPASQLLAGINPGPNNVSVRNDYPAGGVARDAGAGLKLAYVFPESSPLAKHTLTSITSVSTYHMNDYQDGDSTDSDVLAYLPVNGKPSGFHGGLYQYGFFDVLARTEELRLTSPDQGRFKYLAGFWYGDNHLKRDLTRAPVTTYVTDYSAQAYNTSYAFFSQASYDITPQTSVVAGLRLNKEDTGYTFTSFNPPPATTRVPLFSLAQDNSNRDNTGKLGLEHHITPDAMAYLTYSTGHKGVAYDLTSSFNPAIAASQPVPGEWAHNIEGGLKLGLLNNRMSLDLAAFRTNFSGFQQSAGFYDADGVFRTTLHSIGGLRTSGLEADLNWKVSRQLLLNGSFAYTKAIITDFENGPCYSVLNAAGTGTAPGGNCAPNPKYNNSNVANLAGATLPNAPKVKLNLGGQYDIPGEGTYDRFVTAAYRFQSATQFNLNQDPMTKQGAYGIFNLGLGMKDKKDSFKLTLMVNNLFDKSYATNLANNWANGTWSTKAPNPVLAVNTTQWTPARDYRRYFSVRADFSF